MALPKLKFTDEDFQTKKEKFYRIDYPNEYILGEETLPGIDMTELENDPSPTIIKLLEICRNNNLLIIDDKRLKTKGTKNSVRSFSFQDTVTLEIYNNIKFNYDAKDLVGNKMYNKIVGFDHLGTANAYSEIILGEKLIRFVSTITKDSEDIIINGKKLSLKNFKTEYSSKFDDYLSRKKGFLDNLHETNSKVYRAVKYLRPICENHQGKLGHKCFIKDEMFISIQTMFDKTKELREQGIYNFEDYPEYTDGVACIKSLHVDHIDGNPENNNEDNLQVLCPICHQYKTKKNGDNLTEGRGDNNTPGEIQWTSKTDHNEDIRSYLRGEVDTISLLS